MKILICSFLIPQVKTKFVGMKTLFDVTHRRFDATNELAELIFILNEHRKK